MKMVMDDAILDGIVKMLTALQDRENANLPLYEKQLREAERAIENLLNAIQQGILTKSTKQRLDALEAEKEELETKIACEKLAKPKISAEFMSFWLRRFQKLDVRQEAHRKMLIDTFVNAIYLYDDKMVITYNYKDGTDTITFGDVQTALADRGTDSAFDASTAPKQKATAKAVAFCFGFRPPWVAHLQRSCRSQILILTPLLKRKDIRTDVLSFWIGGSKGNPRLSRG